MINKKYVLKSLKYTIAIFVIFLSLVVFIASITSAIVVTIGGNLLWGLLLLIPAGIWVFGVLLLVFYFTFMYI